LVHPRHWRRQVYCYPKIRVFIWPYFYDQIPPAVHQWEELAFTGLFATAATAEVDLVKVPATCGAYQEVMAMLSGRMPNPHAIAKGGDSRGEDIVLLIADANYWALVAKVEPDKVCVVASGYNWAVIEPKVVGEF
jgi:hypothetical protein